VYTDPASNFVGIGRNFRISGNEVFGLRYTGSPGQYGGMYVETSDALGWPFYGYATNGSFRAWTYYTGDSAIWRLYNAGIRLSVPSTGGLRIGPALDYSLVIENTTGSDGVRILDTGDDAIQMEQPRHSELWCVHSFPRSLHLRTLVQHIERQWRVGPVQCGQRAGRQCGSQRLLHGGPSDRT